MSDQFEYWAIRAATHKLDRPNEICHNMGAMVRDEGRLNLPMFNDFVDASDDASGGYVLDPNGEQMNGFSPVKCWLA